LAYFAALLHSQTTHQNSHFPEKGFIFNLILTEPGFLRKFCHSPLLTDQREPSCTKVSLFRANTSRLEGFGHKRAPSLSLHSRQHTKISI